MKGFQVVTSDEYKYGQVAEIRGDNLIVEHGTLRKTRHAVPKTFAHADEGEQLVRLSVPKEIIDGSPKVDGDSLDEHAVAEHYGLSEGFGQPETERHGDVTAEDSGRSAEQDAARAGIPTAAEERLQTRTELEGGGAAAESPALLGDRLKDR